MAKVTIRRRNDSQRADGTAPLYAVLYLERTKIRLPLDISVSSAEWDKAAEKVRGRGKSVADRNLIIDNVRSKITEILVRARLSGEKLTRENFMAMYRRPEAAESFIEYARSHLEQLRFALRPESLRHHEAAIRKLAVYAPDLKFSDITLEWLLTYANYLREYHGNNPGTINKNMSVIRMHFYAGMRAGKSKDNPFELYKLPTPTPSTIYLTEEEFRRLTALYKDESLKDNEQDVLRFFLFMAFTGMHFSDARSIQIEQIVGGEIQYRRIKTRSLVKVPLSQPAIQLVQYYRAGRMRGQLMRSLPSNQAFNRIIKKICTMVGIDKAVSAKAARHTFATIYYKRNNGDLGTLSKLLGHARIDTTMIYAHIMKEDRLAGMKAFDDMM